MKRKFAIVILLLAALSANVQAQAVVSLDEAINNSALHIQNSMNERSKIIVYQFQSNNSRLSDYVLNELFDKLVNSRKFIVLDRAAEEVVNAELDFQFNKSGGMISDESLASLTQRIGAEAIVTGSLDNLGSEYRFRIRVIGTETMAAITSYTTTISIDDKRIKNFEPVPPPSTGDKIGTGALNIFFGLGSYLEGDIAGGLTITAGYAVAAGLIILEAAALDWDSPAAGVPGTIGICTAGLTLVYGFARPFIYNRSPQLVAVMDNTQIKIVQAPGAGSAMALQLSWSIKY